MRDAKALRAKFFQLIAAGVSTKEAAQQIGISDRSRTRFLQERRERGQLIVPAAGVDDVRKFAENGHRIEDVAMRFTMTLPQLRQMAALNGFTFRVPVSTKIKPNRNVIDLAEVQRLAGEGYSRSGIANHLGIDRHRMQDFIRDNNVEITWGTTRPRTTPDSRTKKEAQALRHEEYVRFVNAVQQLLLEQKTIQEIADKFDKNYDFIYRLIRSNDLRQPTRPDFAVPAGMRFSVTTPVGKQIVQRDTSMAGDRPCMTCGQVFRSWHKRNNQRCEKCKARDD